MHFMDVSDNTFYADKASTVVGKITNNDLTVILSIDKVVLSATQMALVNSYLEKGNCALSESKGKFHELNLCFNSFNIFFMLTTR
jgi:hypothetical protein